ncbi:MAG: hypothetical protein ACRBCS_00100 [Cellvibrionaceae bacterium]
MESSDKSFPWQSRKGWKTNRISSRGIVPVVILWVVSIILVIVGFFIWQKTSLSFVSLTKFEWVKEFKGNKWFIPLAVFLLISLLVFVQTLLFTFRYRRFGKVEYVMDPYPGGIGGHVGGNIEIGNLDYHVASESPDAFQIILECVYSYVTGTGKNRSRKEKIKWAESGSGKLQRATRGSTLVFRFDVPEGLHESDIKQSGDHYFWRLKINADLPGLDLKRSFNIPVFATGEHSKHVDHDLSAQADLLREKASLEKEKAIQRGQFHLTDLGRVAKIKHLGSELSLHFPMFRNKALTVFALIFSLGFGLAVFGINGGMTGGLSFGSTFSLLKLLFSLPFALVAFFATIAAIYLPFNNLRVTVSRQKIKIIRKLLFIPVYVKTLPITDVSQLIIKKSGSTGQGIHKVEHYKILAVTREHKKVTIAEDINGQDLAEHFKNYLSSTIGISELFR